MEFLGAPRPDVPFPMAEMTEMTEPGGGGPKLGSNLGLPPLTAQRRSVTGYDATGTNPISLHIHNMYVHVH
jgi:hypothetical protein